MINNAVAEGEISGTRAIVGVTGGDQIVSMRFRVGQADETLATRGFTHLAEHLALSQMRDVPYPYQGSTGPTVTQFIAVASAERQASFLESVAGQLAAIASGEIPEEEIAHEAKVLSAEQDLRDTGVVGSMLNHLYGARGLGLMAWNEYGLQDLDVELFRTWVGQKFCRANAVLAFHNEPSPAIDLEQLDLGRKADPFVPSAIIETLPSLTRYPAVVGLAGVVERDNGGYALTAILAKELTATLRHSLGASYAPQISYMPISSEHAMIVGSADIKPEEATAGAEAVVDAIERLASVGPTDDEIEHQRESWRETNKMVGALAGFVESNAEAALFGDSLLSLDEIEMMWTDLDADLVRTMALRLADGYLISAPGGAELDASRIPELPEWPHDAPVDGKRVDYKVGHAPVGPLGAPTLYVGDEGLTLSNGAIRTITIQKDDAALMLHSVDGTHTFVGAKGEGIIVVPSRWNNSSAVIRKFRSWIDPHQMKQIGFRGVDPDAWNIPSRFGYRRAAFRLGAVAVAVLAIAFVFMPVGIELSDKLSAWPVAILAVAGAWWYSNRVDTEPAQLLVHYLDGAGWHLRDPAFGINRDTKQAYVRGGLLLEWIVKNGLLERWVELGAKESLQSYRDGDLSAAGLFEKLDGVLATDMVEARGRRFLMWMHAPLGGKKDGTRITEIHKQLAAGLLNPYDLEFSAEKSEAFAVAIRKQMRAFVLVDHQEFTDLWKRTK